MFTAVLILLAIHGFAAVMIAFRTYQRGVNAGRAVRWALLTLGLGLMTVGIWSAAFRDEWTFFQKVQGILISGVLEAAAVGASFAAAG